MAVTGQSHASLQTLAYDYLDDHWPEAWPKDDDWIGNLVPERVWTPAFEDWLKELEAAVADRFIEWVAKYQPGRPTTKKATGDD